MAWFSISYTLQNVLLGSTLLGIVGGVLGVYALLRRQSLLGDALAHAALPGVCVAFLVMGTKDSFGLLIGALLSGGLGAFFILLVVRGSRIKEDSAIGIVLSVFFAIGVVLLTMIQKRVSANQSGLDHFLFGQAATLVEKDVLLFSAVAFVVLALILLFYKEFKILCFDRVYGKSLGFPMASLELLLTGLLVVVVVVGLQTVGVVLMVASLITPAAAARQWTDRFAMMLILSAAIGGLASALGVFASASISRLPTGPSIVLVSSFVLVLSLLFAPGRGMLWALLQRRKLSRRIHRENFLKDLYRWGESQEQIASWASIAVVMGMRGQSSRQVQRMAEKLFNLGLLERHSDSLRLSEKGLEEAAHVVRKHRIWELYLSRRLELAADHVHRDAEAMEHALSDEALLEFEALLGYPEVDPHGRKIPPARASSRKELP